MIAKTEKTLNETHKKKLARMSVPVRATYCTFYSRFFIIINGNVKM